MNTPRLVFLDNRLREKFNSLHPLRIEEIYHSVPYPSGFQLIFYTILSISSTFSWIVMAYEEEPDRVIRGRYIAVLVHILVAILVEAGRVIINLHYSNSIILTDKGVIIFKQYSSVVRRIILRGDTRNPPKKYDVVAKSDLNDLSIILGDWSAIRVGTQYLDYIGGFYNCEKVIRDLDIALNGNNASTTMAGV